jgi:hypothetical protein
MYLDLLEGWMSNLQAIYLSKGLFSTRWVVGCWVPIKGEDILSEIRDKSVYTLDMLKYILNHSTKPFKGFNYTIATKSCNSNKIVLPIFHPWKLDSSGTKLSKVLNFGLNVAKMSIYLW